MATDAIQPVDNSSDLGFGSVITRRHGYRLINRDGSFNVRVMRSSIGGRGGVRLQVPDDVHGDRQGVRVGPGQTGCFDPGQDRAPDLKTFPIQQQCSEIGTQNNEA